MPHYLTFEPESEGVPNVFNDYTLGNPSILPTHFGTLAPVNIFLGENNSGKSRFMRQIMKNETIRRVDVTLSVSEFHSKIDEVIALISESNLPKYGKIEGYVNYHSTASKIFNVERGGENIAIDVSEKLKQVLEVLDKINKTVSSNRDLLNVLVANDLHDKFINKLESCVKEVHRIKSIYLAVEHGGLLESGYTRYERDVNFVIDGARILITGVRENYAWSSDYRTEFAKSRYEPLMLIENALLNIINIVSAYSEQKSKTANRTYIPTLRTARTLIDNQEKEIVW